MSHLVPTQITDKNGVLTTRHMKSGKAPAADKRAIPPVAPPVTSLRQPTNEELAELLYPDEGHESAAGQSLAVATKLLRERMPEALPLIMSLLSSGTERGRAELRERLDDAVTSVTYSQEKMMTDTDKYSKLSNDAGLNYALNRFSESNLRQWWNCGNVMEESGFADDSGVPGRLDNIIKQEFKREYPKMDATQEDDAFWRGCTAYTIVDALPPLHMETSKEAKALQRGFYRDAKKFIPYAGKHKDIALVISIAKERQTINVSEIKDIIARGNVAPSIRDGVL